MSNNNEPTYMAVLVPEQHKNLPCPPNMKSYKIITSNNNQLIGYACLYDEDKLRETFLNYKSGNNNSNSLDYSNMFTIDMTDVIDSEDCNNPDDDNEVTNQPNEYESDSSDSDDNCINNVNNVNNINNKKSYIKDRKNLKRSGAMMGDDLYDFMHKNKRNRK